jgi:hypothetical protein
VLTGFAVLAVLAASLDVRMAEGPASSPTIGPTGPSVQDGATASDPLGTRSEARAAYEAGQAAFLAAEFDTCVEQLTRALAAGQRDPPQDIAAIAIRLALGECKLESARARADATGLREARAIFESIAADAPALGYSEEDVRDARRRGVRAQQAIDELGRAQCDVVRAAASAKQASDARERALQARRTRQAAAVAIGTGVLLVIAGGGLVGYGAWLSPEARRLGDDTRPWRAYGGVAIGFGVTSLVVGVVSSTWGAVMLQRGRVPRRDAARLAGRVAAADRFDARR